MKWRCALLQRWLPEYPDGELSGFWRWRLKAHLKGCPACRQELATLKEVEEALKAAPPADPGVEFWAVFNRELHLKLAQTAHAAGAVSDPPRRRGFRLPYLVGAPAVAILLLMVVAQYLDFTKPVWQQTQVSQAPAPPAEAPVRFKAETAPKMAAIPQKEAAEPAGAPEGEQFVYVISPEEDLAGEDDLDLTGWELDSVLAGMSDQEKEDFLRKLRQRKKDGSCVHQLSSLSWA